MAVKTKQALGALASLAQETRLAIFRLLVERGPAGLAAGAIAERLGVPDSSLSFHLAHLTRAGLLVQRRDGRSLVYSADFGGMNALVAYLTENCCRGRPEDCGLPACDPVPVAEPKNEPKKRSAR
ncbi:MAG TPA: metalloregulator ArsR/SmtB family transcription factor [Alphaproteobacteria bacterium]|nr:metalloregulator ArsR/SmtB family transcription factor [Alphaproteobacteria bacterium]